MSDNTCNVLLFKDDQRDSHFFSSLCLLVGCARMDELTSWSLALPAIVAPSHLCEWIIWQAADGPKSVQTDVL